MENKMEEKIFRIKIQISSESSSNRKQEDNNSLVQKKDLGRPNYSINILNIGDNEYPNKEDNIESVEELLNHIYSYLISMIVSTEIKDNTVYDFMKRYSDVKIECIFSSGKTEDTIESFFNELAKRIWENVNSASFRATINEFLTEFKKVGDITKKTKN